MPYVRVDRVAVGEGAPFVDFVVRLDAAAANEVRMRYYTDPGTASHGGTTPDYVYQLGTLVFAPGETSKTVRVVLIDGTAVEAIENFWLILDSPVNATIGQAYTSATIHDNDGTAGTPAISVSDVAVDETAQVARFFVSLSRPSSTPVTVSYAATGDTATAGQDFLAGAGATLTFAPGEMVKTVTVDLIDDSLAETEEFFRLALSNPIGATLADASGTALIGRNDAAPTSAPYVLVKPVAVSEGETYADFTLQLSAPSQNDVRVRYYTDPGTASHGGATPDYEYQIGTLVFAPGETTKTVRVSLLDGTAAEPTETFWLTLDSPVNAVIPQAFTAATIFDNDQAAGTPAIRVGDVAVDESAQTVIFHVSLDRPATSPVTVSYATADDTASAGQDYTAGSGTLSFAAGETVKTVTVNLADDTSAERDETFKLVLGNPVGGSLADATGTALIGRNDAPPTSSPHVVVTPIAVSEGDTYAEFVLQLAAPSQNEARLRYYTEPGTASHGGATPDYQYQIGTLVFAPGETTTTVRIPLLDNTVAEPAEGFWLMLDSPVNVVIPKASTPAAIFDNDGATGTPAISIGDVAVDETTQTAKLFVSLNRPSTTTVRVNYATAGDTATPGEDFTAVSGMLSFAPGEMVKAVAVDLIDDGVAEGDETFDLVLSGAGGGTLADATGVVRIGRNDAAPVSTPHITVKPIAVSEGETYADFALQLSAPSQNEVRVRYYTDAATASHGGTTADYLYDVGTLIFAPGETTKLVRILMLDGTAAEPTETFSLVLDSPVNAVIPQSLTWATVFDNDGTTGTPAIAVDNIAVDETAQTANFHVSLSRPSVSTVTVGYATVNDTAVGGQDFTPKNGALSFGPGEMVKTVTVNLANDTIPEGDELFRLVLSNPVNATLADAAAAALIGRNDSTPVNAPQISVAPIAVSEGDTYADLVMRLSAPSPNEVRVRYYTDAASASHGSATPDYQYQVSTLTFAPGETVKPVRVVMLDDTVVEPTEDFALRLDSPVNATIATATVPVRVFDNDGTAGRQFDFDEFGAIRREGNAANDFAFEVKRLGDANVAASVDWAVVPGAVNGADFTGGVLPSSQIQFAPGETARLVTINVAGDSVLERHEDFRIALSNPVGAAIYTPQVDWILGNDDKAPLTAPPAYGGNGTFLFDPAYYLWRYPELVPTVGLDATAAHYLGGGANTRDPNSFFDATYYRNRWSDLTQGGFDNATLFLHFNLYGVWEGRSPGPKFELFDGNRYLSDNPDVAAYVDAFIDDFLGSRTNGAIAHYIIYGSAEQRLAFDTSGDAITLDYLWGG